MARVPFINGHRRAPGRGRERIVDALCVCPKPKRRRCRRCLVLGAPVAIFLGLVLGLGLGLGLPMHGHRHGPVVDLAYAEYRGTYLSNNISEYLGMRFAQPPKGDLRWRAPVAPKNESKIQDADKFGPICVGISQNPDHEEDEDCLFVNVWGPTNATAGMKLPVMLFIQGGGYTVNANANWNGSDLVQTSGNNIIFVNFNYRVSLWGFLAGEEVRADGDLNVGLLDQRFLMHWVQQHIAQFGGDPNHVIIQGVSAGAGSVGLHLVAYGGRDDHLFKGAIAESTFFPAQQTVSDLESQLKATMIQANCATAKDRMKCLRSKSTKALQHIDRPRPFPNANGNPLFYWTPCIDGDFLQHYPSNLFQEGKFVKVPILFGTCTNEGSVFAPNAAVVSQVETFFHNNYPGLTDADAHKIPSFYPLEPPLPKHNVWFPSASAAYGDATFICPTYVILNSLLNSATVSKPSSRSNGVESSSVGIWSYRYNVHDAYNTAQGLGIPHVYESFAVFGVDMLPMGPSSQSYRTYNAPIIPVVMNYWISFVRALDPNVYRDPAAPEWQPWTSQHRRMLLQTGASAMENLTSIEEARCSFWQSIGPTIQQKR